VLGSEVEGLFDEDVDGAERMPRAPQFQHPHAFFSDPPRAIRRIGELFRRDRHGRTVADVRQGIQRGRDVAGCH
jgi:hypothetical protein